MAAWAHVVAPWPVGTAPAGAAAAQACQAGAQPRAAGGPRALGALVGLPQQLVGVDADCVGYEDELGDVEMTRTGLNTEDEVG